MLRIAPALLKVETVAAVAIDVGVAWLQLQLVKRKCLSLRPTNPQDLSPIAKNAGSKYSERENQAEGNSSPKKRAEDFTAFDE